jgi:eukaryotic-like serine/threonine-protein kinase
MTEREIFLAAVEKDDPTERAAYLGQACGGDATLRQRVEALLRSHERAADFMEEPVVEQLAGGGGPDFLAPSQQPGSLGRLGHYEVLEVVGRGGMGTVFRAFDTKLHRVVALKALAPQVAASSAARQRFVREARAAAAVTHDNVIAIHTVEDAGPVPYLVMQFIDGPTLQQKLDRTGPLSLKEVLRIGLQVAEGLAAAHRQGLVHRDVKPANVLLENGVERVKLTDFGLARAVDDASLTQSGVVAGTPQYMSPEQARGEAVDPRSDLFSLGSVLYAMCTGRPPFRAESAMAVLKRVCEEMPRPIREINPELPPWLGDLVARLHAKAPADRFASAQEVADLLARHLAEVQHGGTPSTIVQPPPAKPPAEQPAPAPPGRSRRRWLMAAAVLLALPAGLGLGEATGVTDVRGRVMRLFSPEGTPAPAQGVAAEEAAWERTVAALPAEEQVKAVADRLKDLNPGFDGKVTPTVTGDVVTRLRFSTDRVTNIAPVRALGKLTSLDVSGSYPDGEGKLADLSPLKGLPLSVLHCSRNKVSDLSPLKGMPLTLLECAQTPVSDLTPLKGMPLRQLSCGSCPQVSDLSPLQGMRLSTLDVTGSRVSDLSPLKGMPLKELDLFGAKRVRDLSPLKGMPLEYLNLGHLPVSDLSPLKGMTALHNLILSDTPVTDLSLLKGLPLKTLMMSRTNVSDLAPLRGMPLKRLWLDYQPERDAEALRSLKGLVQINGEPAGEFLKAQGK